MGLSEFTIAAAQSHGKAIGIAICADINHPTHPRDVAKHNASIDAAGVAITPKGIGEAESNMSDYARKHCFVALMANHASATGGFAMAGRSAVWDPSGRLLARGGDDGECLVFADDTANGWRGRVTNFNTEELS